MLANYETVFEVSELMENHEGYIRTTAIIEIEFNPIKADELIKTQVAFIDNEINKVKAVSGAKLVDLERQKSELLALPAPKGDL
jgi:hypothetical protein